LGEA
jgi:hypothetical protein